MSEKIDLRGLTCPEPVIRTKKLFDNHAVQSVEALVDDEVCVNNLTRLAGSLKAGISVEKADGYYRIAIERNAGGAGAGANSKAGGESAVSTQASGTTAVSSSTGTVLFLAKDTFGEGDPELSHTLINLFLQTTFESGLRPRAILMANSGVKLMAAKSQVLPVLNSFRDAGVEVLACGLCLDFYKLKEQVPTAQITNMFAICEFLFAADRVIQP
ncbi:MAG: sulfurtransferase-like selenium metabolism protein YedF [Candidatus Obscuribacterales bacterium]